ncbi:hypothetical protein EVAR_47977_1 [Eumeta japonica]|uniref:Uncharacterized protein n=1 Tax=Eumeta variegata TaxID=151549 RepID=A0A4C1XN15_EUMVA|nr:hypothetical protein EVAR_47977_1 [Eumeta japonica]
MKRLMIPDDDDDTKVPSRRQHMNIVVVGGPSELSVVPLRSYALKRALAARALNFPRFRPNGTLTGDGIEIANGTKRMIESRDWGGFEVDNGTKNVIDRGTKIEIKNVTGSELKRKRAGPGSKAGSEPTQIKSQFKIKSDTNWYCEEGPRQESRWHSAQNHD